MLLKSGEGGAGQGSDIFPGAGVKILGTEETGGKINLEARMMLKRFCQSIWEGGVIRTGE